LLKSAARSQLHSRLDGLEFLLYGILERVVPLDAEESGHIFQLGAAKPQLDGPQVIFACRSAWPWSAASNALRRPTDPSQYLQPPISRDHGRHSPMDDRCFTARTTPHVDIRSQVKPVPIPADAPAPLHAPAASERRLLRHVLQRFSRLAG
jgi:hypothetical protein